MSIIVIFYCIGIVSFNSWLCSVLCMQVFVVAVISVLRCVVSMTVNAAVPIGDITDKVTFHLYLDQSHMQSLYLEL